MVKAQCMICNEVWGVSKYALENSYVCPKCAWRIKHNIKINLGRRTKSNERKLVCIMRGNSKKCSA